MSAKFKLGRTNQCSGCPWKASVNPADIPNGFCPASHAHIGQHTAAPGQVLMPGSELRIMQCHDSPDDKPQHCAGWLHNQLRTEAVNVGLRVRMMSCENIQDLRVEGEQRPRYADLIPQKPRRRKAGLTDMFSSPINS